MPVRGKTLVFIICYSFFACQPDTLSVDYIEISDLSKQQFFVRNCQHRSWFAEKLWGPTNNVNYLELEGKSDSTFSIEWGEFIKDNTDLKHLEQSEGYKKQIFSKGSINMTTNASEYYGGDSLWIKYTPIGARNGRLRLRVVVP